MQGYPLEALESAVRLQTLVPVDCVATQGEGEVKVTVKKGSGESIKNWTLFYIDASSF